MAPTMTTKKIMKPQFDNPRQAKQERSKETETRILKAVLRGLAKYGYAQLSTQRVADLAKLSKAALFQRFPNKTTMVVEAMCFYFNRTIADEEARVAKLQSEPLSVRVKGFIDAAWQAMSLPEFIGCFEAYHAARTEPEFYAALQSVMKLRGLFRDLKYALPEYAEFEQLSHISAIIISTLENMAVTSNISVHNVVDAQERLEYLLELTLRELALIPEASQLTT